MKTTLSVLATAALCAAIVSPQLAHANLLVNGGLEVTTAQLAANPGLMYPDGLIHASSSINANALTGWSIGGACIDIVPTAYWQNTQGSYSVDMIGTSGIGIISQTVTGLTPGSAYALTFDFSINPENITNEISSTKFLQITASNTDLAPTLFSGTAGTRTKTNMQYLQETVDFTPNASAVTLTLSALMPTGLPSTFNTGNVFCGPVIDNLDLEALSGSTPPPPAPTPEPASLGILGISGLLLLRRKRH